MYKETVSSSSIRTNSRPSAAYSENARRNVQVLGTEPGGSAPSEHVQIVIAPRAKGEGPGPCLSATPLYCEGHGSLPCKSFPIHHSAVILSSLCDTAEKLHNLQNGGTMTGRYVTVFPRVICACALPPLGSVSTGNVKTIRRK
jgi:hypothetical protein